MDKIKNFTMLLKKATIKSVFQPIVSLENGSVFAYEGLSRVFLKDVPINIEKVFAAAKTHNHLWELEVLCRTKVLENSCNKPVQAKLFINVDANIMNDPQMKTGFTYQKIRELGLEPEKIVFEITEKSAIARLAEFSSTIKHYREQKYFIAVDDYGSGHSGLNRVCAFAPDFIKIDMDLIRDVDKDAIKKSIVGSTVRFCKESGIKVIAEGIETKDELKTLIELGVDYGQGYFLVRPDYQFKKVQPNLKLEIKALYYKYHIKKPLSVFSKIKQLCEFQLAFSSDMTISKATDLMQLHNTTKEVFVVDKNSCVVGVIRKKMLKEAFCNDNKLNENTLKDFISKDFLVLDCNTPIEQVAKIAMQRSDCMLYDAIAISKNDKYIGNVSVQKLLLTVVQLQKENNKIA